MTYTEAAQRALDIQSGLDMDRRKRVSSYLLLPLRTLAQARAARLKLRVITRSYEA